MDHVTIISKEAILTPNPWPAAIVGLIVIASIIGCLIYLFATKNTARATKMLSISSTIGIFLFAVTVIVTSVFFRVPTGRYTYRATIDKDKMTLAEYDAFMNDYQHLSQDNGIYYFNDK